MLRSRKAAIVVLLLLHARARSAYRVTSPFVRYAAPRPARKSCANQPSELTAQSRTAQLAELVAFAQLEHLRIINNASDSAQ